MIEAMGRFLKRGSRPIAMLATALSGGYLALSYIQCKLNGMHDSLNRTRVCTENLRRRFEQNQQDCSFTILALIPTLGKQIIDSMNLERLVEFLSQTKSNRKPAVNLNSEKENCNTNDPQLANGHSQVLQVENENPSNQSMNLMNSSCEFKTLGGASDQSHLATPKSSSNSSCALKDPMTLVRPDGTLLKKRSEIWTEMMLVTFSRLFACLYGLTLLTLQTHIQLGLLGRDLYLSSITSTENLNDDEELGERLMILPEKSADDITTERRYLTFSWWYLHKGWLMLASRIRSAVEHVLSSRTLKDAISPSDLLEIFNLIRARVELESDGAEFNFASILLPITTSDELDTLKIGGMPAEDCQVDARLRSLLNETHDFIDCPDFRLVLSRAMDQIINLSASNIGSNPLFFNSLQHSAASNGLSTSSRFTQLDITSHNPLENTQSVRLVDVLPIISKESLDILNNIPNTYVETLSETTELKEFSSVIYTTFDGLTNATS